MKSAVMNGLSTEGGTSGFETWHLRLKFLAFLESQGMGLRTIERSTKAGIGGFETHHLALNFLAFRGKPTIVLYPLLNPLAIDRSHNHIHTTQNWHNIR